MKKILLLTGMTAIGLATISAEDTPTPKAFEDVCAYAMSANGEYFVSEAEGGLKIVNVATGKVDVYSFEGEEGSYTPGIGTCVSNSGIVVGSSEDDSAVYWKDGKWTMLEVPAEAVFANHANAITADGYRICGNIGTAGINFNDDVLMQAPCVWTWNEEKGDYDLPVLLPHPDLDFTGRVPQYVTAVDIADDGKTIIGQVMTATGMYRYPILYTENNEGEWSYRLPDEKGLYPEGVVFPEYPGDAPIYPSYESYMTAEEIEAYNTAVNEYFLAGDWSAPYPEFIDFMSAEQLEAYNAEMEKYYEEYEVWDAEYNEWNDVFASVVSNNPSYEFNSIRISPDGKKYANTIIVEGEMEPDDWFPPVYNHIWVFDIETGEITKYDQNDSFTLTFLGNEGAAMAVVGQREAPKSYVLKNGICTAMQDWLTKASAEYGTWIDENLTFEIESIFWNDEIEGWDYSFREETLTGRAYATPDLSKIVLGVENVWDYMNDGVSVVFDMSVATGVSTLRPAEGEKVIYDLNGRKLKNADAPGIYIINGEKKVVR